MWLLNILVLLLKFKYEDLLTLAPLLWSGDFITMINLKDGFHHISILLAHQHLLAFTWQNWTYAFQGIQAMAYMDNVIILGQSYTEACCHTTFTLHLFEKLGWMVNAEKSDTTPSQCKEFLGLMVNTSLTPMF